MTIHVKAGTTLTLYNGTATAMVPTARGRMIAERLDKTARASGVVSPTGLTSKNIVERFAELRTIIGAKAYNAILKEHGYRDVLGIPTLESSQVYRALLEVFRFR